jgi:hypothetical protein
VSATQFDSPTLPFDKDKQHAVLGHFLTNPRFFLQAVDKMKPDWYANPYSGRVVDQAAKFYAKHRRAPNAKEVENSLEVIAWELRDRNLYCEAIRLALHHAAGYGFDALSQELTSWYHARTYHKAMRESSDLFNRQRQEDAYDVLTKAVEEIRFQKFEADKEERFDSCLADFEEQRREYKDGALTFGLTAFDKLLTPKAEYGSLLRGDTSIVLAPSNIGKTSSMLTTVVANIRKAQPILWITHEGRPSDLKEKLWCCMLGVTPQQLLGGGGHPALAESPEGRRRLEVAAQFFNRYLTYVPMNKPGLTVEEVASSIRFYQERRLVEKGEGYHLLVDDYPAKLTTRRGDKGNMPKRSLDEVVYDYFVQLALEYEWHSLLAIQSNREGARINKGQRGGGSERLLTMEDVHESYGPMQMATNVWSVNRDAAAAAGHRLTFYIDKSRSSETGWAVVCRTNYACATTHSDELGATWYRGASTHSERLDQLLSQYSGKGQIPDAVLLAA